MGHWPVDRKGPATQGASLVFFVAINHSTDASSAQILHVEDLIDVHGNNCNPLVNVGDLLLKVRLYPLSLID